MNSLTCGYKLALNTDGKHCVSYCDKVQELDRATNEWRCVETCPEWAPYAADQIHCVDCASYTSGLRPVWDPEKHECVPCPRDTPNWDAGAARCTEPCPADKPLWNWY